MNFSVQTDNLEMLKKAVESDCDEVRFGSEFCEWKIPSLEKLEKAYNLVNGSQKKFTYVTSRVSISNFKKIREHLMFIDKMKVGVVINDLGVLNVLQRSNLKLKLGRQLVYIPSRCPWKEITDRPVGFFEKRQLEKTFYQTSLNYTPTIQFFQNHGIQDVEVDWIPNCFPYFDFLVEKGLNLSIHLYLVPVVVTRKCHTARFVGEKNPESCSQPCDTQAFLIRHNMLGVELFLHGNVAFRVIQPSRKEVQELCKIKVTEFIITLNPITKIENRQDINTLIQYLSV